MAKHSNLSGAALHYPIGRSSEGALDLEDDAQYAYQIKLGSSSMFNISTANGSETVSLGNSTDNPKILCPGTGNVGIGTLSPSSPNGNQVAVQLTGTSVGLVLDSTNGSGVPWEMQHNSGDMKIIYDGANTLGGGAKTAIALDASGTMRLGAEVATPSDPGAGNGGFVYVKTDGKLYFRSNSTTETDLTAGGGGVTNPMTADLTADGYYVKFNADTGIKDEAGNESLLFGKTTSAVNHMAVINAAAGGEATAEPSTAPALRAVGTTTNLDLALEAQGTGTVTIRSKGTDSGTLTLNAESNTKYINIKTPLNDDLTSYTLVLPGDDGDADQVLKTDGSGNLDWVTPGAGATKITLSPSQHTVTGTTETLIGSVYLDAGTITTVRALFGEQYAAHTASLRLRKFTGGGILHTFTSVAAPAAVSTTSLVVAGADWYDVFLFTDDAAGVAFCSGLFIEY